MSLKTKKLSILIPSHLRDERLMSLLRSLQPLHSDHVEIIVVLNPVRDLSEFSKLSWVQFETSEKGSNRARRKALEKACGEWLWFIDDDCLLPSDFSLANLNHLLDNADVDAYAGVYLPAAGLNPLAKAYFIMSDTWQRQCFKMGFAFLLGGNCLIRRSKINLSFWPEEITFGGAEIELNLNAHQNGLKIQIEKGLGLLHCIEPQSSQSLRKKAVAQSQGSYQISMKAYSRLLSHPLIDRLYPLHPVYLEASSVEKSEISQGFEIYKKTFRHYRKKRSHFGPLLSFVEEYKNLKLIYHSYRTLVKSPRDQLEFE